MPDFRNDIEPWQSDDWLSQREGWRGSAAAAEAHSIADTVSDAMTSGQLPPQLLAAVLRAAYPQIVQVLGLQGLQRELTALRARVNELEAREQSRLSEMLAQMESEKEFARELYDLQKGHEKANPEWFKEYDLNSLYTDPE